MPLNPVTKISVCSQAVSYFGQPRIRSFEESLIAAESGIQFDIQIPKILSVENWRFATKYALLNQLLEPPPENQFYKYRYELPADYLALNHTYPPSTDYDIYANSELWANRNNFAIEYRYMPVIESWPYYFVDYAALMIAFCMAPSAAVQSVSYTKITEEMLAKAQALALAADGKSHPTRGIQNFSSLQARGQWIGTRTR